MWSAYEVVQVDKVLTMMCGRALQAFAPQQIIDLAAMSQDEMRQKGATLLLSYRERKILHNVTDQCKVTGMVAGFLQSRLRSHDDHDTLHRLWNCCKDGIKAAGLWPYVACLLLLCQTLKGQAA